MTTETNDEVRHVPFHPLLLIIIMVIPLRMAGEK
jgi:hypothetical protein